jgi:hypothetical protein
MNLAEQSSHKVGVGHPVQVGLYTGVQHLRIAQAIAGGGDPDD